MSSSTESKQNESGSRTRASNHHSTANSRQTPFRFCAPYHWMPSISAGCSQGSRPASTQSCGSPGGCNSLISVTQEMQLSKPEMPQLWHSCTHPALSLKQSTSALWHSYSTAQRKQDRKTKQLFALLEYHLILQFQTTLVLLQQCSTSLLPHEPIPRADARFWTKPPQNTPRAAPCCPCTVATMTCTATNPTWRGIQLPHRGCFTQHWPLATEPLNQTALRRAISCQVLTKMFILNIKMETDHQKHTVSTSLECPAWLWCWWGEKEPKQLVCSVIQFLVSTCNKYSVAV